VLFKFESGALLAQETYKSFDIQQDFEIAKRHLSSIFYPIDGIAQHQANCVVMLGEGHSFKNRNGAVVNLGTEIEIDCISLQQVSQ
jgi:hypothetical protein